VFLIQVNGDRTIEPSHRAGGGKGPRKSDDPLEHNRYVNGGDSWEEGIHRRRAWERIGEGDIVLLYTTHNVPDHSSCLSYVYRVGAKSIGDEGARLEFDAVVELTPEIDYEQIRAEVANGDFTEEMRACGTEGFNFKQVEAHNFDRLRELTTTDFSPVV
jgi:hypothetical protein